MQTTENIIELRNVSKYFDDVCALSSVDLSIVNGEFLTLLGPSGCGKTTILRLISGFEKPTTGHVFINGRQVNDLPPEKRQVNTVFQNFALFPHMTVFDNVAFGLKMQKVGKAEINERVREILRTVHLENLADRKPHQLSGGQQQRVALARAIVNNPVVLLLDEPFSALDFRLRQKMQLELKHLQRKLGITFVFVTHDQEEALAMSDRVVVMNQGHIEQTGTPQSVYEEPANMYVARFVGEINVLDARILQPREGKRNGTVGYMAEVEGVVFPIRSRRNFDNGEDVKVLLRPEDLKVAVPGTDDQFSRDLLAGPHFMGRIEESVYKGATVDILIRLDNGKQLMAAEFFNEDDEDINYTPGERVAVAWVDGWEVILKDEDETGARPVSGAACAPDQATGED